MSSLGVFWAALGKSWGDLGPFLGGLGAPWGVHEAVSRARWRGGSEARTYGARLMFACANILSNIVYACTQGMLQPNSLPIL